MTNWKPFIVRFLLNFCQLHTSPGQIVIAGDTCIAGLSTDFIANTSLLYNFLYDGSKNDKKKIPKSTTIKANFKAILIRDIYLLIFFYFIYTLISKLICTRMYLQQMNELLSIEQCILLWL